MKTRLCLLLFVLAVPLLTALVASAARDRWDERWTAGLRRELRAHGHRGSAASVSRYSLDTLCADPRRAAGMPACRTYNRLSTLVIAGAAVSGLGALWIGAIAGAGAAARRWRRVGPATLRPVLYGSAGLLAVLLVAHGLLAVQAVGIVGRLLIPSALVRSIGSAAGLAAAVLVGLSAAQAVRSARRVGAVPYALARVIGDEESAPLRASLRAICSPDGPPADLEVVAGLAPAVFAAPGPVDSLDGRRAGPILHVPLTLARILTVPECEALLAAQVWRVRDDAARRAARFSWRCARVREEAWRVGSGPAVSRAAILPAVWWLTFVADSFAPAAASSSLDEEAGADRAAVAASGGEAYGAALIKAVAFAPAWDAALRAMSAAVAGGEQYASASQLFAEIVAENADPMRVEWAIARLSGGEARPARRWAERLAGAGDARLVAAALDIRPAVPATTLFGAAAARLETDLSDARHLQLR